MSNEADKKKKPEIPVEVGHDSDEFVAEIEQQNSFEKNNQLFELRSKISTLRIEKQKLALEHESAMKGLQAKNQQLTNQVNLRKRENASLMQQISKLQQENEELKQIIDSHRRQVQSLNRRTADFHHSIQQNQHNALGDPTDLINELLQKDKQIQKLKKLISQPQNQITGQAVGSKGNIKISQSDRQKLQQQIRAYKQTVEDLKKKQIAYKRQYESMIQSKQQIIRKMSLQNDDQNRKIIESKDKIISQLRKQIQQVSLKMEQYKNDIKNYKEKLMEAENKLVKLNIQRTKQSEQIILAFEQEKQTLTKGLTDRIKKQLKEQQQKLSKNQETIYGLQTQIQLHKQEISKLKAQISSLNQFTSYLQNSNKQIQENRQKMQKLLFEKQKQLGDLRNSYFKEMTQYKTIVMQEKAEFERKYVALQQQLIAKKYISEKYEKQLKQKDNVEKKSNLKQQYAMLDQIQALRNDKVYLSKELQALQQKYKQKTEKLLQVEIRIKGEYETRVKGLQKQVKDLLQKANSEKKQLIIENQQNKESLQTKYSKLQMVCQVLQLQKQQKDAIVKKIGEQKIKLEGQLRTTKEKITDFQNKLKEKDEDLKNLQSLYQQLNEKYKRGVRDLQDNIQQMSKKIQQQRRKAQRRKFQSGQNEQVLKSEAKILKQRIKQLQSELDVYKTKKIEQSQATDVKLEKLTLEISAITKQKEALQKQQSKAIKQKEQAHINEKMKLMQLINELQQNNQILNQKIGILNSKQMMNISQLQQLDRQLKNIKVQYSMSLQQVNQLLQKCKQLQHINRDYASQLTQFDILKNKHDNLHIKYNDLANERNKLADQLNSSYDQINKLNKVLMGKQEEINKSRVLICPHIEQSSVSRATTQYIPTQTYTQTYALPTQNTQTREYPIITSNQYPAVTTYLVKQGTQPQHSYSVVPNNDGIRYSSLVSPKIVKFRQ